MKILMVCLGNICRSPLAEGILQAKLDIRNHQVDSAGTAAYHVGNPPDPRSIAVAYKHRIDIHAQKARQFTSNDFEYFDRIYVMDRSNYQNVIRLAANDQQKQKIALLRISEEVPDPYYGGDDGFEKVFQMIDQACSIVANQIQDE